MLRKIILLRHAKSSWKDPSLRDFDRPLSKRGVKDTKLMKEHIASLVMGVDEIYSSPSIRTSQTINQLVPEFPYVKYIASLYLGDVSVVLSLLAINPSIVYIFWCAFLAFSSSSCFFRPIVLSEHTEKAINSSVD